MAQELRRHGICAFSAMTYSYYAPDPIRPHIQRNTSPICSCVTRVVQHDVSDKPGVNPARQARLLVRALVPPQVALCALGILRVLGRGSKPVLRTTYEPNCLTAHIYCIDH